jgi:hypothetical protein
MVGSQLQEGRDAPVANDVGEAGRRWRSARQVRGRPRGMPRCVVLPRRISVKTKDGARRRPSSEAGTWEGVVVSPKAAGNSKGHRRRRRCGWDGRGNHGRASGYQGAGRQWPAGRRVSRKATLRGWGDLYFSHERAFGCVGSSVVSCRLVCVPGTFGWHAPARKIIGRVWLLAFSLARMGPTIFRSFGCLGRATLLHEPLLKAVSDQALEERPVRQFPTVQANLHAR